MCENNWHAISLSFTASLALAMWLRISYKYQHTETLFIIQKKPQNTPAKAHCKYSAVLFRPSGAMTLCKSAKLKREAVKHSLINTAELPPLSAPLCKALYRAEQERWSKRLPRDWKSVCQTETQTNIQYIATCSVYP